MGDRCFMEVKCRKQDAAVFEALGFQIQDDGPAVITMFEEEANYAHYGELPASIPWTGWNGSGGCYGESVHACDGKEYVSVETGTDRVGFVVGINEETLEINPGSMEAIKKYFATRKRAEAMIQHVELDPQI